MVGFRVKQRLGKLLLLATSGVVLVPFVRADPVTLETLKTTAVAGWNELERLDGQTTYEVTTFSVNEVAGRPRWEKTERLSCYHKGKLFLIKEGKKEIEGGNAQYLFTLDRTDDDAHWTVSSLSFVDLEERPAGGYGGYDAWCLYRVPLQRIVTDPSFEMLEAEETSAPSGQLVTVHFKIDSRQRIENTIERLAGGRFTCKPARNWAVESYDFKLKAEEGLPDGIRIFGTVTYGPPARDYLNLEHFSHELTWLDSQGRKSRAAFETTVHSCSGGDLPDEKFTLSAFGLPEPGQPPAARWAGPWLWFVVAGITAIVVAVLIRRRA